MKKFFEKYDLIKIALGMILLTLILTWVIPQVSFSTGELVQGEITRMGIFDFFTYGILGMYYFTVLVTFILVLGGFYQFLSKLVAYQKLTDSLAKKIKGKEIIFSLIVSFIFAALASIVNEYFVLIAFMPFIITLCSKAGMDKISSFVTTFGAMLVGILGSTISTKIVGMNVQYFQTQYTDNLLAKIIFFFVAFIVYSLFNVLHLRKDLNKNTNKAVKAPKEKAVKKTAKASKKVEKEVKVVKVKNETKEEVSVDLFENKIEDKKANILPLVIVGILTILTILLAYLPWTTVFEVDWFTKAHEFVTDAKLFEVPIFSYIFGNVYEFGSWDLFSVQVVMILVVLILKVCYKVDFNTVLESFIEGFKKVGKLVFILLLSYTILVLSVMYPVIPTIVGKILGTKFNVITTAISGLLASLFTSEYQYTVNILYSNFASLYTENLSVISMILQLTYGFVSFFAPSSAMLLVGLSYLEIPYKNWMKYIWKFLVIMLVAIIVLAFIIA